VFLSLYKNNNMALVYLSSSASDFSDDEDIINFVVNLGRIRKNPRLQIRRNHLEYWDDQEFYIRFRLSKKHGCSVTGGNSFEKHLLF
jgi:hypothetical protein